MHAIVKLVRTLWDLFITFALKFGVVGLIGFFVDLGVFNLLRVGAFGTGHFFQQPLGATIISVGVAMVVTWAGNRYWTFRHQRRKNMLLELVEFAIVGIAGLGISLLCVWISHYVLGFTSLAADNIAKNVVGLGLGTAFRFVLYRYWVYGDHRSGKVVERPRGESVSA